MEFELSYFEVTLKHFSYYGMQTPFLVLDEALLIIIDYLLF